LYVGQLDHHLYWPATGLWVAMREYLKVTSRNQGLKSGEKKGFSFKISSYQASILKTLCLFAVVRRSLLSMSSNTLMPVSTSQIPSDNSTIAVLSLGSVSDSSPSSRALCFRTSTGWSSVRFCHGTSSTRQHLLHPTHEYARLAQSMLRGSHGTHDQFPGDPSTHFCNDYFGVYLFCY